MYFTMEYKFKVRCFSAVGQPVEQGLFRSCKHLFFCHHCSNSQKYWQFEAPDSDVHVDATQPYFCQSCSSIILSPSFPFPYCLSHRIVEWLGLGQNRYPGSSRSYRGVTSSASEKSLVQHILTILQKPLGLLVSCCIAFPAGAGGG